MLTTKMIHKAGGIDQVVRDYFHRTSTRRRSARQGPDAAVYHQRHFYERL